MTKEQALQLVALLNAGFPREALEEATIDLYASEIALLHDPSIGLEAAQITVRQGERFPAVSEFRATYRSVSESRRADVRALPEAARPTDVPEWVKVWWWLRHAKHDERMVPQQDEHGFMPSMSLREVARLRDEWVAAGSPPIGDIFLGKEVAA